MTVAAKKNRKPDSPPAAEAPRAKPSPWEQYPLQQVPLDKIVDRGHTHRTETPRDGAEKLRIAKLAESMAADGQLQAILVYRDGGSFCRVFGSRRCAAAAANGWKTLAAHVCPSVMNDEEVHRLRAIENFHRRELNPAERAIAATEYVKSLETMHGREKSIVLAAADLDETETWIGDCLHVTDRLQPGSLEVLASGAMNLGQARELAKVGDAKLQVRFAKEIAEELQPPKSQYSANAGRGGRVVSAMEIRGWIENHRRSLRVTSWPLDVLLPTTWSKDPVRCDECPNNTAAAAAKSLFDPGKDELGAGFCNNEACYEFRQGKAEKEKQAALAAVKEKVKAKEVDKQDAGNRGVVEEALQEKKARFVKPEAAQRFVKKELGVKTPAAAAAQKAEKKEESANKKQLDALLKWGKAYDAWVTGLRKSVEKAIEADPIAKLAAILLGMVPFPDYDYPTEQYNLYPWEKEKAPKPRREKALTPSLSKALDLAARRTLADLGALAAEVELRESDGSPLRLGLAYGRTFDVGPELARRVAVVFAVKLSDPPAFENFLPKDQAKPVAAAVKAPEKSADGFDAGVVVTLKLGGDLGEITFRDGEKVTVLWADGSAQPVKVKQLRLATPAEQKAWREQKGPPDANDADGDFDDEE